MSVKPPVRVRSREGAEVTCSREAARSAGTLRDMIDDSADGICPVDVPAAALRVILDACNHADGGFSRMASHSSEELVAVMVGANYLDAPGAFSAAARQFSIRFLAGKSVEELRTNLGATDRDMSEAEQAAALAEPAFTPPPQEPAEQSTAGPPRGVFLLAGSDVLEAALEQADAAALRLLKAVSVAWRTRARRALCNRLCRREGQPELAGSASITDLDVERLKDAGRPWEVVVAGRQLPQLERLHGFGFVVDVQAVRQVQQGGWGAEGWDDNDMKLTITMSTPPLAVRPCAAASRARGSRHTSCCSQLWPARCLGRCAGFLCSGCGRTMRSRAWSSTLPASAASQRGCSASCCRLRRLCAVSGVCP